MLMYLCTLLVCFYSNEGKEMTVDVEPTYTIAKIKELLEEKEGIPVRSILLNIIQ